MDRLGAGLPARLDDTVDLQIALRRRWRADAHRLIRLAHMQRVGVGIGIDRHRLDAHAARRAHDAAGDLAAIGDEDLAEHEVSWPDLAKAECCRASSRDSRASSRAAWRAN